ncbi:MAG: type II toxin-antitoxin system VapC family toxin [Clostridia bacterium]|nr:type II toxin-antitoxin system VapC family toxin [Deltaproteobacteria bacterium]
MTRTVLVDTGFVVALVNKTDPDHERCTAVWGDLHARLLTVEGVLVESTHMLRKARNGPAAAIGLLFDSAAKIIPASETRARRAIALMAKYRDVPMDFVDAMLVVIAEERRARDVLTLDRRGFEAYRILGRERFRLLPEQA